MNEIGASTVVLDNGAYTAKVGLAGTADEPMIIPNCIMKVKAERRRAFIGNQIDDCRDASGLFYLLPFQKGYLLNWDVQKSVWDHIFSSEGANITLENRPIIITEPQLNFGSIQEGMMELLFEEYHCASVFKTTAAELAAYNSAILDDAALDKFHCVVIDVGFSFMHVVPIVAGKPIQHGIRRIDVGGKVLTNHLKEIISYRHLNVMDETYVVNQIKEDVCFVSQDFKADMQVNRNKELRAKVAVEYVLPDFTNCRRGFVRKPDEQITADQQTLHLCNERFTVPELLFFPSDVGIRQMGIAETVMESLKSFDFKTQFELLRNVLVFGGTSLVEGFIPRLKAELRSLAAVDLPVSILFPEDPISFAWQGGKQLASNAQFENLLLTRHEYDETGYVANSSKKIIDMYKDK